MSKATQTPKKEPQLWCDNCGYTAAATRFPAAKNLLQRLDIGGIFTSQECPKCGALAYPLKCKKPYSNFAKTPDGKVIYECTDCHRKGPAEEFPEAPDVLLERIDPGNHFTDRECPECGMLVYPKPNPQKD